MELNTNVDILFCKGLNYMQEAIDNILTIATKCKKCLNIVEENIEYGPHLFIDTTIFTDDMLNETKHPHTVSKQSLQVLC